MVAMTQNVDSKRLGFWQAYASDGFWSSALSFPFLRGLILGIEHMDSVSALANIHPGLCQQPQLAYHRLAVGERRSYGERPTWSGIYSSSLQRTGNVVRDSSTICRHCLTILIGKSDETWKDSDAIAEHLSKMLLA